MAELWAAGLVVLTTLIGSFGPIFLKKASAEFSLNPFKVIKNKELVIGIFFYAMGTVLFIPALKGGELSVLYPLVSLAYVWVALLSKFMLKENINALKWAGILLIIIGVSLIGLGS
jgi:multidrug transporter EmrE-like cation transporter